MKRDSVVEISIRDLPNMTKDEVRELTRWMHLKIKQLESQTAKGKAWLITRRDYAKLFRFSLKA